MDLLCTNCDQRTQKFPNVSQKIKTLTTIWQPFLLKGNFITNKPIYILFLCKTQLWLQKTIIISRSENLNSNSNPRIPSCIRYFRISWVPVKPLSQQKAMPQRWYSVLKPCTRAVGSPRNTPKISNLLVIACTQRPYSAHTTFPQRLYSVHDVFTARKQLLQRVHSAQTAPHTASSRRLQRLRFFYLFYFFL